MHVLHLSAQWQIAFSAELRSRDMVPISVHHKDADSKDYTGTDRAIASLQLSIICMREIDLKGLH